MSEINKNSKLMLTNGILSKLHSKIKTKNDYDSKENSCNSSSNSIFETKNP